MVKTEFTVTGMSCAVCAGNVEKTVGGLKGVKSASVNLATTKLTLEYDEKVITPEEIKRAVEEAGYGLNTDSFEQNYAGREHEVKVIFYKFLVSLIFTAPLFYISMGHMVGLPLPGIISPEYYPLRYAAIQLLLSLGSVAVGYQFYTHGYQNLFRLHPNMDSLVAVGTSAAFLYGLYLVIDLAVYSSHTGNVHHLYFESVGVIITLILLGKYLENRSKLKTNDAIKKLIELAPKKATVLRDGKQVEVPVEEIVMGDIVLVSPGEKVSVDGEVAEGSSTIDESMLTGESIPVEKVPGDKVFAGCINKYGYLHVKATEVSGATLLSQIIRMVERASGSKPKIARLADKIAGVFVPTVIGIALLSALVWTLLGKDIAFVINIFISVMVIACPCALGLATPTAVIVSIGRAASMGILVKDASALEILHKVDTILFDKTGTLTIGEPRVTDVLPAEGFTRQQLMQYAMSAEKVSEHPLGDAIVDLAAQEKIEGYPVESFEAVVGKGIRAAIHGKEVLLGNRKLMEDNKIAVTIDMKKLASEGKTPILAAIDGRFAGAIAAMDQIKPDAAEAIRQIHHLGKKAVVLTGDNKYVANAVAKQLGVDDVIYEVLPGDKANEVQKLQKQGQIVAMVGDGINDSVAITAADVGMTVGSGTEIALESADIVIMKNQLMDIIKSIELSNITIRNIKQNLFFAFVYNTILIPVAAGVLYGLGGVLLNPMIAACAMALSSVSVVSNALRIKTIKIR